MSTDRSAEGQRAAACGDQEAGNTHAAASIEKPASGQKNALAERKPASKRVLKSRNGYTPRARNALYALAAEFKRHQPQATAREAWEHFTAIANSGVHQILLAHDPVAGTLSYHPDAEKFAVAVVSRRGFEQQWYRIATDCM